MEVLFEGCYLRIFHSMPLHNMLFYKTVAAFRRCCLIMFLWTWSIKISVVETVFSSVGGRALSSVLKLVTTTDISIIFSVDFSSSICKATFLVLLPLKSQKNNMKFRKINSNVWKDICTSSVSTFSAD